MYVLNCLTGVAAISVIVYGMSGNALAARNNTSASDVGRLISEGEPLRSAGNLALAQDRFDAALVLAGTLDEDTHIAALAASGYNEHLLQGGDRADQHLLEAYRRSATGFPYLHAVTGNYLGMASISEGATDLAHRYLRKRWPPPRKPIRGFTACS
ncbi:MAG: hypothetical protein ACRERU_18545 [Methylococcales bacterium]